MVMANGAPSTSVKYGAVGCGVVKVLKVECGEVAFTMSLSVLVIFCGHVV